MFEFYYAPETISLASHIALLDAGVEPRLHRLDIAAAEHQQGDYARLNPKLRVPTLVTPEGGALTETPAILAYLAQRFPAAGLAPRDPFAFAKLQEFASYVASTLHVAHAHRMRGHRWVDPANAQAIAAMQAKVPESVGAAFAYIEETYQLAPFVMGESYSFADPYLFTVSRWLKGDGVPAGAAPKVEAHRAMMLERPNVQAVLAAQAG
ncbi:glutathione S-transferase family protein [Candidatus Rhodobacter oscarellae]|nr:glutathione S-transferase family protein [Candidatus Rhodobacter lobularis]